MESLEEEYPDGTYFLHVDPPHANVRNLPVTFSRHAPEAAAGGGNARAFLDGPSPVDMHARCKHVVSMSTMIQIRNVPEEVHRAAKARAALEGRTLSDFALAALQKAVARPTVDEISARVRLLEPMEGAPLAADLVRAERDAR